MCHISHDRYSMEAVIKHGIDLELLSYKGLKNDVLFNLYASLTLKVCDVDHV